MTTRGFQGRGFQAEHKRLPPGQHLTSEFPVLSAGPTPHTPLGDWTFTVEDEEGESVASWGWEEFHALGPTEFTTDIHCVTRWSKFDTRWRGVAVERIFEAAGLDEPPARTSWRSATAVTRPTCRSRTCSTARRWSWEYDGEPLEPAHGGPARLLRAAPVLLEVRQVGPRAALHG